MTPNQDEMHLPESELYNILGKIDFDNIHKHPNILIAARFWEEERFEAALTCYKFMRAIDDLIDDRKALDKALTCMEKKELTDRVDNWMGCLDKDFNDDPFLAGVSDALMRFRIPLRFFHRFASSMIYDIDHNGFDTFQGFLDYAEGASNGPASVFVHLCCLRKEGPEFRPAPFDIMELSRPCAIFSYIVHIIRDFQADQCSNLNYFSTDILAKNGLTPTDLGEIARGGHIDQRFRNVVREYMQIAGKYRSGTLIALEKLGRQVEPRYLLSLQIIFDLYSQVFERIDADEGRFTTTELNPSPGEVRQRVEQCAFKNYKVPTWDHYH